MKVPRKDANQAKGRRFHAKWILDRNSDNQIVSLEISI
jgi:hypothetical protein